MRGNTMEIQDIINNPQLDDASQTNHSNSGYSPKNAYAIINGRVFFSHEEVELAKKQGTL